MKQMKDPGTTGNFEVTVDGKLIHSKKHQGLGEKQFIHGQWFQFELGQV